METIFPKGRKYHSYTGFKACCETELYAIMPSVTGAVAAVA